MAAGSETLRLPPNAHAHLLRPRNRRRLRPPPTRVLLPYVAAFKDETGNITNPEVTTLLSRAAQTLIDYTKRLTASS